MSAGKGMSPRKGYNQQKYAENYDQIFRTMKTNQEKQPMTTTQPAPVLAWHREATKELYKDQFYSEDDVAAIIAAHDPHAAQDTETVRLLEAIIKMAQDLHDSPISLQNNLSHSIPYIRARLATLKGEIK